MNTIKVVFSHFVNSLSLMPHSKTSLSEKTMKLKPLLVTKDKGKLFSCRKRHFSAVLVLISTVVSFYLTVTQFSEFVHFCASCKELLQNC